MSVTQTTTTQDASDEVRCTHCNSVLPPQATFCSTCGERVQSNSLQATLPDTADIIERYRITSLLYHNAYTQVFLAMDTLHSRPVVIRNIDITDLNDDAKLQAVEAAQREYDVLRRQHIPDVTPLIDLRYFQEHLFTVGGWPFPLPKDAQDGSSKAFTHTLHDLLQSGIGLPSEQVALAWLYRLSGAIGQLHNLDIVLGNLDPTTIVVSDATYNGVPALSVSWLPTAIRSLTTLSSANEGQFVAPEARLGPVEARSDIYSLGVLLYLLLTGSTPDNSTPAHHPWHGLRETNPRIPGNIEAIVMRALSTDMSNRFQRVEEMEEALLLALEQFSETYRVSSRTITQKNGKRGTAMNGQETIDSKDDAEEVTISIVSLQSQLARLQFNQLEVGQESVQDGYVLAREAIADTPTISTAHIRDALLSSGINTPQPVEEDETSEDETPSIDEALPEPMPRATPAPISSTTGEVPLLQRFTERITGVLPALKPKPRPAEDSSSTEAQTDATGMSFFKRLQRFLLGEQQHTSTAAALIETPLRVQPNQGYTIRIHLMGREVATAPSGSKKGTQPVGLSAIVRDEIVHIEVRSAIFQNYAYVAQRADVQMPGDGFAAEVLIPMQTLSDGPSGRRERLHIFFMDEMKRPLYEKPFAVEVFVSRLVQSGREGHNVLTIPL